MGREDEDLGIRTFIAGSPENIDRLVNEFRKQHVVRYVQALVRPSGEFERIVFYVDKSGEGKISQEIEQRKEESGFEEAKLSRLEALTPRGKFQEDFKKSIIDSYKLGKVPSEKQKLMYTKALSEMGELYGDFFK